MIRRNMRGTYDNPERGRQLIRFDGFQYGTITPTDVDAVIDYHDQIWVLFEVKMAGKDTPRGQKLALERLIQNARRARKHGIAMVVEHGIQDPSRDIMLRDCMVREVCTTENMRWRPPRWSISAKAMADAYINYHATA